MTKRERTAPMPTIFGIVLVAMLVVSLALRFAVADPSVMGIVWGGLAGAALLGALWPLATVRLVGMKIIVAPTDLVVGQLASIEIELTGRASGLTLRCTGSPLLVIDVVAPSIVRVPFEVSERGAYSQVRVEVGSDAPFGVLLARRSRVIEVPRRLLVGPVTVATAAPVADLPGDQRELASTGVSMSGESVRSVRPYVVGDPSHLVHWPTTARVGSLVVRELEPPVAQGVAIVVDLTPVAGGGAGFGVGSTAGHGSGSGAGFGVGSTAGHGSGSGSLGSGAAGGSSAPANTGPSRVDAGRQAGGESSSDAGVEFAASVAAGAAESALDHGARVVLCTVEAVGPVVDEVTDLLGIRRRLALAVDGPPPAAPEGWPVMHVNAGRASSLQPDAGPGQSGATSRHANDPGQSGATSRRDDDPRQWVDS